MSLAPRSLVHAIHEHFNAPRLRSARTPRGERALVFEHNPMARPPAEPVTAPAAGLEVAPAPGEAIAQAPTPAPSTGLGGRSGRFMDDNAEVGFRSGLLRSSRDAYDLYVVPPEREAEISRLGPIERTRLQDDGPELPAIRITPEVRQRIGGGDVASRQTKPQRLMFGIADGETPNAGEYRTNADGFIHRRPFGEQWGDNRYNPEDRARSMSVLEEIKGRGPDFWRTAPWEDVVRAADDINTIVGNLFYYAPDSDERIVGLSKFYGSDENARRWYYGGEVGDYMRWREGTVQTLSLIHI